MSRGFGVAAGSTRGRAAARGRAARSSATTRCGPTTTPARRASRPWPSSPPRPAERSSSASRVIALDRQPPAEIAADIERLGLDPTRLWIGVGAGFSEKPLTDDARGRARAARGAAGVRLVLAAMGPKMCALAGAEYDGAFFNWMTPEFAARRREHVEAGAARGRARDAAGLRLRPHRRRRRRRRPPRQGGVLLPRPPRRLPQPLRPARRARGHASASPRADAKAAAEALAAYEALDTVVVRGLASASARGDGRGRRGRGAMNRRAALAIALLALPAPRTGEPPRKPSRTRCSMPRPPRGRSATPAAGSPTAAARS